MTFLVLSARERDLLDWPKKAKEFNSKIDQLEQVDLVYAQRVFQEKTVALETTQETRKSLDTKGTTFLSITVSVSTAILAIAMNSLKANGLDAAFWTYLTSFSTMAVAAALIAWSLQPVAYEDKGFHVDQLIYNDIVKAQAESYGKHWLYLSVMLQRRELTNRVSNEKRAAKLNAGITIAAISPLAAALAFGVTKALSLA